MKHINGLSSKKNTTTMDNIFEAQLQQPHAVCIPFPAQGHINPMLQLAKLLHYKNFHITFVNTEYNHNRLLRSHGPAAVAGLSSFRFETIPDGLPQTDGDTTQDLSLLCASIQQHCLGPFKGLISRLNKAGDVPPVSCIVSDAAMFFTLDAAQEFGIPEIMLWTASVCALLGDSQYPKLLELGIIPFKDANFTTNGDLDLVLDWIPPSMKDIQLKYLPTMLRTTNPNDIFVNFVLQMLHHCKKASAILFNSFEALDHHVLQSFPIDYPTFYTLGPLQLLLDSIGANDDERIKSISTNLWKEDQRCLEWLDSFEPKSVVYLNFGSITVMTNDQLTEFAWGLANSNQHFLWITRPDLVVGGSAVLPNEFLAETKDRGFITNWCDQEQVLAHSAIGGFLTHCGWNSTLESLSNGVPMICWPFFADQQTNCWFCCNKWGIGMEVDANVTRIEVERQVRELIDGEKGIEMKRKVLELRKFSHKVVSAPNGSSYVNFDKLVKILESLS